MRIHPRTRPWAAAAALTLALVTLAPTAPAEAGGRSCTTVAPDSTWTIDRTTTLSCLVIKPGGTVTAVDGRALTLTVNGVETGGRIAATGDTATTLAPGSYRGRVVLTVTDQHTIDWAGLEFSLRQALYVDSGVVGSRSVPAAYSGNVTDAAARNLKIASTGEAFTGVYIAGGDYALDKARIALRGNGRSDFVGSGAAVVADGGGTVVVSDTTIRNSGVVRTGILATGGTDLVVKNSTISTREGTLPQGYESTVDLAYRQPAPWMLGIVGTVRTTNLMGSGTRATYLDSDLSSSGWGVLSTDTGQNMRLTSINSRVRLTGDDGYGAYGIGNAELEFLGTSFDVADYAAIIRGATVRFGDSERSRVAALNRELGLGLTARELKALRVRPTTITSDGFGVMWHGPGDVTVDGGTRLATGLTTFQVKDQAARITVDGADGAKVTSGNGILVQVMPDDDPGPVMVDGHLVNAGVYREPTEPPTRLADFDTSAAHDDDVAVEFSDIAIKGDLYNAARGDRGQGRNLVLTLDGARLTGTVSSAEARHAVDTITAANYQQIGQVTNTASPAVNNGLLVTLTGRSTWTVTGTSHLTSLTVGQGSRLAGAHGRAVKVSVNGAELKLRPGVTYTGDVVVGLA